MPNRPKTSGVFPLINSFGHCSVADDMDIQHAAVVPISCREARSGAVEYRIVCCIPDLSEETSGLPPETNGVRSETEFFISTVKARYAVKPAHVGKFGQGFVFVFRFGAQRHDILYADIIDEITKVNLDIFIQKVTDRQTGVAEFFRERRQRQIFIVVIVDVLHGRPDTLPQTHIFMDTSKQGITA